LHVWREERSIQALGRETCGRDHLEDAGVDGRIIRRIVRKWDGVMDCGLI